MPDNQPIDVKTNIFNKKMVKDLNRPFMAEDIWEHARNSVMNTHNGDLMTISNEPSNKLCYEFISTPLSHIELKNNRLLIIQSSGEFGILNSLSCKYEKLFTLTCPSIYKFTCKPIQGKSRLINDNEEYIVFGNEDIPISELNLSKIPYKYTIEDDQCKTKTPTKEVDCEELYLFKKVKQPCIEVKSINNGTGNLPNGTYQLGIVYNQDGEKYSDYYSLTTPYHIYNSSIRSGSLSLKLSNIDRNFDTFRILVIANITSETEINVENYFLTKEYNTSQSEVTITDLNLEKETLDRIVFNKKSPTKVNNISGNSDTLMLSDLIYSDPVNYQLQAMNIKMKYVIKQVPFDFYKTKFDFGYYGDENYAPYIVWFNNKGEPTERFHIPGPKKRSIDSSIASGDNVYEFEEKEICNVPEKLENWQVENTASKMIQENNQFFCNERIIGRGEMGYYESEYKYPDNKELYGEDACTNIRYPKFPDECKVPRFSIIDGKTYINIKAWEFYDIEHPLDKDGNPRTDIVGYQIIRKERGNTERTILATGYLSNVRGFEENGKEILYQNYPYNDRSPDSFHSLKQTISKNNKEIDFEPLTKVYANKFSFYSPDSNYGLKTALGQELKIYTEESGSVIGNYIPTYNHPKAKLITNFSYYLATLLGIIQVYLEFNGKVCKTTEKNDPLATPPVAPPPTPATPYITTKNKELYQECDTLWNQAVGGLDTFKPGQKLQRIATAVLQTTAKVAGFTMLAAKHAEDWLNIIENFSPLRSYAYQYNSVATFNESKCVNKRRFVKDYQYIRPYNTSLKGDKLFANEKSNKTVYVEVHKDVPFTTYLDDTNKTITESGLCKNVNAQTSSNAAMYYAASKIPNRNQYGELWSGNFVKVHNCIINTTYSEGVTYKTPVLFGGDCVIVPDSFQTRRQIFSQSFANDNYPNGLFVNFRQYANLAHPRYWYDSEKVEWTDIISRTPSQGKMPAQRHNLDCRKNSRNLFTVKDEYIYTSVNGVVNYIVEADANLWYREQVENKPHYSQENTNLAEIFRSDRLEFEEEFKLNSSYFKLEANQIFYPQQEKVELFKREKNALIYSLPGYSYQTINNWKYFLPNNRYSFDNLQFGNLTGIHSLDQDKLIFLFDKSSPYVSLGRSELQLSDTTITLGDGGLFARQPRELMHTDVSYGATQSKYAFSSNQFGHFYPSASQGRLFRFGENLEDVTRQGIHHWAKTFMPFRLKSSFPNYTEEDNSICGIGYLTVFDNSYETLYICKKDYIPLFTDIVYDEKLKVFKKDGIIIKLTNKDFFKDVSWTLSYKPSNEGFISFHDWHPDSVVQLESHFLTQKGNSLWLHNDRCDSYCNFYGIDYPWEIAPVVSNGQNIMILDSFEYHLEAYHYINNCLDRYHVLGENFNKAMVFNSEQHSGLLNITTSTEITTDTIYNYPKTINNYTTELFCSKKENRYRFNGFKDNVKDRGEVSGLDKYVIKNDESGYKSSLYTSSIDTEKWLKKFRHKANVVWLAKDVSGKTNYIFQFLNSKQKYSFR